MILSAIAAMSPRRVIGINNTLPWHVPEDLKYFRETTKNKILILGRKTFDSLGGKPLPGRMHIVVTRQTDWHFDHPLVQSCGDVASAKKMAEHELQSGKWGDEVFVIGGAEIYKQTLSIIDRLYLTVVQKDVEGDAHFPEFSEKDFVLQKETAGAECRFLVYANCAKQN